MNYRSLITKSAMVCGSSILLLKLAGLVKFSYMVGTYSGFFSGMSIAVPLAGAFAGVLGSWTVFLARLVMGGAFSAHYLAYCIPGLCASLYWAHANFFVRLLLPALCIVVFIAHPVGGEAALYTVYWLIPIALYFFPRKSLFFQALGSTLVAHAVGSVIWLYTVPMTATMWLALIPIVAIERLLFSSGMLITYRIVEFVRNKIAVWSSATDVLPMTKKVDQSYNTAKF